MPSSLFSNDGMFAVTCAKIAGEFAPTTCPTTIPVLTNKKKGMQPLSSNDIELSSGKKGLTFSLRSCRFTLRNDRRVSDSATSLLIPANVGWSVSHGPPVLVAV
eukprot:FR744411.1.p1 GENE.FR744411.1~~FR744411.1.p1  ORF type:complete len:104 (+),score=2.60 FR744411.1:243-554(+)